MNLEEYEAHQKAKWAAQSVLQQEAQSQLGNVPVEQTEPSESDLRHKALEMAISHQRDRRTDEEAVVTAAKFLAFLKGDTNV